MVRDLVAIGTFETRHGRSGGLGLTGNWSGYDALEFQRELEEVRQMWMQLNQGVVTRGVRSSFALALKRAIRERLQRMASYSEREF